MVHVFRLLAVRQVLTHGSRSLLTAAGVAIGAAVVVAVLALNSSVLGGFQGMVDTLAGGADLQVRGGQGGLPLDVTEKLQGVEGVEAVGAFLENWLLDPATGERILLVGVDFLAQNPAPGLVESDVISGEAVQQLVGDPYEFLNSTNSIIINAEYSARL
ncbi:MAG: ABC transporter permease, partial [Myxococcota bacterium]